MDLDPASMDTLVKFVKFFVTKTQFPLEEMSIDQAMVVSCLNRSAVPVVCPSITLALATVYIDRLRKVCIKPPVLANRHMIVYQC